jgi:hypothetical protein
MLYQAHRPACEPRIILGNGCHSEIIEPKLTHIKVRSQRIESVQNALPMASVGYGDVE